MLQREVSVIQHDKSKVDRVLLTDMDDLIDLQTERGKVLV